MRPRHHVCFARIIEGETAPRARYACESALFERLSAAGVTPEMVAINEAGCFFTVEARDIERLRAAVGTLNVALRLREGCARVALTRCEADWPLPPLSPLIAALGAEGVGVVHVAADADALAVVVAEEDAALAAGIMARFCRPSSPRRAA